MLNDATNIIYTILSIIGIIILSIYTFGAKNTCRIVSGSNVFISILIITLSSMYIADAKKRNAKCTWDDDNKNATNCSYADIKKTSIDFATAILIVAVAWFIANLYKAFKQKCEKGLKIQKQFRRYQTAESEYQNSKKSR